MPAFGQYRRVHDNNNNNNNSNITSNNSNNKGASYLPSANIAVSTTKVALPLDDAVAWVMLLGLYVTPTIRPTTVMSDTSSHTTSTCRPLPLLGAASSTWLCPGARLKPYALWLHAAGTRVKVNSGSSQRNTENDTVMTERLKVTQ